MAKIVQNLRTHWKKSIFFSGVAAYGVSYAHQKWEDDNLMRKLSREASSYGEQSIPLASSKPYHVTVILNPAAHGGKARNRFETYCAPLLNLAGFKVSVIRTEGERQATEIMKIMDDTDAVLVAGGDGTLMEAVTGFLRRDDANSVTKSMPVGILPLGFKNYMARHLYPDKEGSGEVALMAEATMSVIRQFFRQIDVMEVKNQDESLKPLYCMREFQAGPFIEAQQRKDKYWYWAGLKKYMTYIFSFTTSASQLTWSLPSEITTGKNVPIVVEEPKVPETRSFWSYIWPSRASGKPSGPEKLFEVDWFDTLAYNGCEISIESGNNFPLTKANGAAALLSGQEAAAANDDCKMTLSLGPSEMSFSQFVQEGWLREQQQVESVRSHWQKMDGLDAFLWHPDESLDSREDAERFFYLDGESVDIRGPLQINLLPEKIVMFCSESLKKDLRSSVDESLPKKWWQFKKLRNNI